MTRMGWETAKDTKGTKKTGKAMRGDMPAGSAAKSSGPLRKIRAVRKGKWGRNYLVAVRIEANARFSGADILDTRPDGTAASASASYSGKCGNALGIGRTIGNANKGVYFSVSAKSRRRLFSSGKASTARL
jgi:hypothetical protein